EPLLRQALEIRWNILGCDHPKSVASMNSLEQLLQMKRELAGHEAHLLASPTPDPAPAPDFEPEPDPAPAPAPEPAPVAVAAPAPAVEAATAVVAQVEEHDTPDLGALRRRLDSLEGEWVPLGEALRQAAEALQRHGRPAPESLDDLLRAGRAGFVALREDLARAAEAYGIPAAPVRDLADRDALAGPLDELDLAAEPASLAARTPRQA